MTKKQFIDRLRAASRLTYAFAATYVVESLPEAFVYNIDAMDDPRGTRGPEGTLKFLGGRYVSPISIEVAYAHLLMEADESKLPRDIGASLRTALAPFRVRGPGVPAAGASLSGNGPLPRRLEQLDRIPVGILDLDLPTARPGLHVVSEMEARFFQYLDERGEILDPKHDAVPSAGFLPLPIRHRPRSRRLWPAEEHLRITKRHVGERGKLLVFEREAQMCRVERD